MEKTKRVRKGKIVAQAESIREEAWRQIGERGPAALSLRAIARNLGVTAPAIYNYYHRRDDLVTALIAEAYTEFAESQHAALNDVALDDHRGRLIALGNGYRMWAREHPERFQVMFNVPYPGYVLPLDIIRPIAGKSLYPLVSVLETAYRHRALLLAGESQTTEQKVTGDLSALEMYGSGNRDVLVTAVLIWTRVHGAVSIEIGGQYPPFVTDAAAVFQKELENIVASTLRDQEEIEK